ncbi:MAG TPA: (4Fe-4S)-binding protein [Acidimicrobiales bacterium]|nr:(4Fe-4S)-binding protein [Acidimicrobiales bacterium]
MARKSYPGTHVTVSFDPEVCAHSGNCVRGLPAVFDTDRHPWIDADGAAAEEVVAQVGLCPSGALRIEAPLAP